VVDYSTHIRIKQMFEGLLPSRLFGAKISKQACVQNDVLHEKVPLSELLLVDSMSIHLHASINKKDRVLEFLGETDLRVPCLLRMFESTITSQIEDSLREYHELPALELCRRH
jgi:hypothetical protein